MVGSPRLLREAGISTAILQRDIDEREAGAQTVVGVAQDNVLVGIVAIADTLKADAQAAIQQLRAKGFQTVMITGDNAKTARAIAKQIGIDQVFAEVLPHEKAEKSSDPAARGAACGLRRRRHQ